MRLLLVLFAVGISLTLPILSEGKQDYSACKFYGDPHAMTLDGLYYELQVEGTRILIRPCCSWSNWFEISAVFYRPYPTAWYTLVKSVSINILGNVAKIEKGPPTKAYYNGAQITSFPTTAGPYHFTQSGSTIFVEIQWLLIQVSFDGNLLKIWVHNRWLHMLCGKCGIFNGDVTDDYDHVTNPLLKRDLEFPCKNEDEIRRYCERMVAEITRECPDLDTKPFIEACVFDECAEKGSSKMSLGALKEECAGNGDQMFERIIEKQQQGSEDEKPVEPIEEKECPCYHDQKGKRGAEGGELAQGKEERELEGAVAEQKKTK